MPKISWLRRNWCDFQNSLTTKIFGSDAPIRWHLKTAAPFDRTLQWIWSRECQHYGAKSRSPNLFRRRDMVFFALEIGLSRKSSSPPRAYHNLLDAAARVGALEQRIGYTFNDKMTCIEALKLTEVPLYYEGTIFDRGRNNRLALLGDRVLSLALCEIWFQTEHTTKDYNDMAARTVSRVALAKTGRKLQLNESMLSFSMYRESLGFRNAMAETFEAVLGAVYVDSKYSVPTIIKVLRHVRLVDHEYLKARNAIVEAGTSPIASLNGTASFGLHPEQPTQKPQCPQPEKQEQEEKLAKSLSMTNDSKQASAPIQLSRSVQKELELLKRYAQIASKSNQRQRQRKRTALAALHEHANLTKQGVEARPLEIFSWIKAGEDTKALPPEDSATNAPVAPSMTDARVPPFQPSSNVQVEVRALQEMARRAVRPGCTCEPRFRGKNEAAKQTLRECLALLKAGKITQPFKMYHKIKEQMGIASNLGGEPKQQLYESATASIDEEPVLPRQESSLPMTSPLDSSKIGVKKSNIPKASKQTMGKSPDNAVVYESEVDLAGFLTFQNVPSESSSPPKDSESTRHLQSETNDLPASPSTYFTTPDTRRNHDKHESRVGDTTQTESTAELKTSSILRDKTRKFYFRAPEEVSRTLAKLTWEVNVINQDTRMRRLGRRFLHGLPFDSSPNSTGRGRADSVPGVSPKEESGFFYKTNEIRGTLDEETKTRPKMGGSLGGAVRLHWRRR